MLISNPPHQQLSVFLMCNGIYAVTERSKVFVSTNWCFDVMISLTSDKRGKITLLKQALLFVKRPFFVGVIFVILFPVLPFPLWAVSFSRSLRKLDRRSSDVGVSDPPLWSNGIICETKFERQCCRSWIKMIFLYWSQIFGKFPTLSLWH